ncbi:hypothetical protein CJI97_002555 [Candidozyma auris]|nr:hypothetical protein CJI97_002555 [[Candida] auris]
MSIELPTVCSSNSTRRVSREVYGSHNGCKFGGTKESFELKATMTVEHPTLNKSIDGFPEAQLASVSLRLPQNCYLEPQPEPNPPASSAAFSSMPLPQLEVKTVPLYRSSHVRSNTVVSLPASIIASRGRARSVSDSNERYSDNRSSIEEFTEESPVSTAPIFDCPSNPRVPSRVMERVERSPLPGGLFLDPFTEYMQDRLARFRPSDGQSNTNAPLDFEHPYQVNEDSPKPALWRNLFSGSSQSAAAMGSHTVPPRNESLSPVVELASPHHSSSLFLPRDMPLITSEPEATEPVETPRAGMLDDIKSSPRQQDDAVGGCLWYIW